MKIVSRYAALAGTLVLACALAPALSAQSQQTGAPADPQGPAFQQGADHDSVETPVRILTNFVEAGGSYEQLSGNYGRWSGGYFRAVLSAGKNTLTAEVNGEHEFGDLCDNSRCGEGRVSRRHSHRIDWTNGDV